MWICIPAAGFVVSCLASRLLIPLAPRIGYHDQPDKHKLHAAATPLLGGIAVAAGLCACCLMYAPAGVLSSSRLFILLAAAAPAILLGLVDDRFVMTPLPKLIGFLVVSIIPGIAVVVFMSGSIYEGMLFSALLFFFTNSLNLLDNCDGLCATVGYCILLSAMNIFADPFLLGAAMCLAGFLVFNWPRARIFLGDTGSLLIGVLCVIAVFCPAGGTRLLSWHLFPIMCVPLYDTFSVIVVRMAERRSVMQGGLDHMSHRLMRLGISNSLVNILLGGYTLAIGIIVMALGGKGILIVLPLSLAGLWAMELLLHHKKKK
jgi:UDP-GlcNAc:undecaprenyl-phosphate GlcNAc-1-phosphate transferase